MPTDGGRHREGAGRPAAPDHRPRDHRVRLRRLAGASAEGPRQGEALEGRAVPAVRRRVPRRRDHARDAGACGRLGPPPDAPVEAQHGPNAVWVAVSHADVIKSVLADALGTHLDLFQRIHVDPASLSISVTRSRGPSAGRQHLRGQLAHLQPPARSGRGRPPPTPSWAAVRARRADWDGVLRWTTCRSSTDSTRPSGSSRDRRPSRSAHLLPAGPQRCARGQRRPGEAAGGGPRRAHRRAARRGDADRGHGPSSRRSRRWTSTTTSRWSSRSRRSSGPAR